MSGSWNQPICERCWIDANGEFDLDDVAGVVTQRLVSLRMPTVVREPSVEECSFCGNPTILGAFVRADPSSVPYPKAKT